MDERNGSPSLYLRELIYNEADRPTHAVVVNEDSALGATLSVYLTAGPGEDVPLSEVIEAHLAPRPDSEPFLAHILPIPPANPDCSGGEAWLHIDYQYTLEDEVTEDSFALLLAKVNL